MKEEIERGGIIPPNQTGFREEMGTIDNIYVLNYFLVNRQLGKNERLALFVDLKAAFDSVNRYVGINGYNERKRDKGGKY